MSFQIRLDGHVSPEDPQKDAVIRRLAHAFSGILHSLGIDHMATVGTPTGGGTIDNKAPLQITPDGTLHTNTAHPDSTPTNVHKP